MMTFKLYCLIALGGALGACTRYFIGENVLKLMGKGFPFATLAVNILGSFLIGIIYALLERQVADSQTLKLLLSVGFLGALTTFSTFSLDTLLLIQNGQFVKALTNVMGNVVLCIFGTWIGIQVISKG